MGKLINRIPASRLLISSLPGSALRTRVGVIKIVIVINCNLITFSKVIACNCN